MDYSYNGSDWFHIFLEFPDRFEEIVMVQAVDIHSAIGNAGGHIGLLLGNATWSFDLVVGHNS